MARRDLSLPVQDNSVLVCKTGVAMDENEALMPHQFVLDSIPTFDVEPTRVDLSPRGALARAFS